MSEEFQFKSQMPVLDLSEGSEMLTDFSRESQRHLISARNSLLVVETVSTDKEAIENIFKTFHTIAGLSDFLQLHDIYHLSKISADNCAAVYVPFATTKDCSVPPSIVTLKRLFVALIS